LTQYKILGIDPGSNITGFCVLLCPKGTSHPSRFQIVDAGMIRPRRNLSHGERAGQIHNSLYSIADYHKPQVCVIEKAFSGVNPLSALRLGETRGAIISAARRLEIAVDELAPTKVKNMITGQGHATKEQIARALEVLVGFRRGDLPFDVTDAVAIAVTYGLLSPIQALATAAETNRPVAKRSFKPAD
jgi:crossover junction endodeoxyribonuclease RuvC